MLELNEVNTYYNEFHVLKDVSLKVNDGELVAIFGANGHGKSTLLKTICGLVPLTSGSIKYDGREISKLPSHKLVEMGLVYVSEERNLFPEMTVIENLRLGSYSKNARPNHKDALARVYQLLPKLKDWHNHPASTLSGGEARMLAIGRGLMSSARFLSIDEPSFGLAPNLRAQVFEKIAEIKNSGITILLVEQNITEALQITDRILFMEDGKIVFESSKEEALKEEALNVERVRKLFLGM